MTAAAGQVLAPIPGRVIALAEVPDEVFAGQLVGAGVAIEPDPASTAVTAVSPVAGTVAKLHPHAFVIVRSDGVGVLVHLGIDTVELHGAGFTLHTEQSAQLPAGAPVATFDPTHVRATGRSCICPVVVLDSAPDTVPAPAKHHRVKPGDPLFYYDTPQRVHTEDGGTGQRVHTEDGGG